jgi:hypothetical protein
MPLPKTKSRQGESAFDGRKRGSRVQRFAGWPLIVALFVLGHARSEEVISTTKCRLHGKHEPVTVEIVMIDGRFYDDQTGWCGDGEKWEGQFEIRIRSRHKVLSSTSVNQLYYPASPKDPMFFWAPRFKLSMCDYNHDGLIDFNLGQYGACNWNEYRIYTIHRNGAVTELPCLDGAESCISVSHASRDNSTRRIKLRHGRMASNYYDNSLSPPRDVTEQRMWKRDKFVLVRSKPDQR